MIMYLLCRKEYMKQIWNGIIYHSVVMLFLLGLLYYILLSGYHVEIIPRFNILKGKVYSGIVSPSVRGRNCVALYLPMLYCLFLYVLFIWFSCCHMLYRRLVVFYSAYIPTSILRSRLYHDHRRVTLNPFAIQDVDIEKSILHRLRQC